MPINESHLSLDLNLTRSRRHSTIQATPSEAVITDAQQRVSKRRVGGFAAQYEPLLPREVNEDSLVPSGCRDRLEDAGLALGRANHCKLNQEQGRDPTTAFFFKPHTISLLLMMLGYFLYVALFETTQETDILSNTKKGLAAVMTLFVLIGFLMFQDGVLIRPHPAFWRLVLAMGVVYLGCLVFILFQSVCHAREIMALYDPALGVPLPDRNYAENCALSWQVIYQQMDLFVLCHIFGWYAKALILRDHCICWILSVMFEVMEYSLEHQLPNFAECWWDHWILDVLTCNWLGIYLGMKTCTFFEMRTYSWTDWSKIPDVRGRMRRTVQQFTPASWTAFHWGARASLKNYFVVLLVVFEFLQAELNTFYLKHLLWLPPSHALNIIRIFLIAFMGVGATREVYEYFYDKNCKKLGAQAWVMLACIWTETMICVKFGKNAFPNKAPRAVVSFWIILVSLSILYPIYQFYFLPKMAKRKQRLAQSSNEPFRPPSSLHTRVLINNER